MVSWAHTGSTLIKSLEWRARLCQSAKMAHRKVFSESRVSGGNRVKYLSIAPALVNELVEHVSLAGLKCPRNLKPC